MPIPTEHRDLYQAFLDQGLDAWLARLPEQLARGLDRRRYGDLPAWEKAVAKLPLLPDQREVRLDADLSLIHI